MEEQSDTPRVDALARKAGGSSFFASAGWRLACDLERELTSATRERDEAIALNVEWAKKAETWMASPEAAQRLQGYRELAQQVAQAQAEGVEQARLLGISGSREAALLAKVAAITRERDEARAEVEREREGCAKACEDVATTRWDEYAASYNSAVFDCAAAIRARGTK